MDRKSPEKLFIPKQSENLQALVSIDGGLLQHLGRADAHWSPRQSLRMSCRTWCPTPSVPDRTNHRCKQIRLRGRQRATWIPTPASEASKQRPARQLLKNALTQRRRAARPDHARTQRTVSGQERATGKRAVGWQVAELLHEHSKVPRHSRSLAQPI